VVPSPEDIAQLDALGGPLPENLCAPADALLCSTTSAHLQRCNQAAAISDL
jgi:hypothetical protein